MIIQLHIYQYYGPSVVSIKACIAAYKAILILILGGHISKIENIDIKK